MGLLYYTYIYSAHNERERDNWAIYPLSCKKVTKVETMEGGDFPSLRFDFKNIKNVSFFVIRWPLDLWSDHSYVLL